MLLPERDEDRPEWHPSHRIWQDDNGEWRCSCGSFDKMRPFPCSLHCVAHPDDDLANRGAWEYRRYRPQHEDGFTKQHRLELFGAPLVLAFCKDEFPPLREGFGYAMADVLGWVQHVPPSPPVLKWYDGDGAAFDYTTREGELATAEGRREFEARAELLYNETYERFRARRQVWYDGLSDEERAAVPRMGGNGYGGREVLSTTSQMHARTEATKRARERADGTDDVLSRPRLPPIMFPVRQDASRFVPPPSPPTPGVPAFNSSQFVAK